MNDELTKQIAEWHEADKHQENIDALEQIPEAERDYETTGLLARAYNNIGRYAKAAELLESVREEGEEDERWNFRMGYAQYGLDNYRDALRYFTKARELDPKDEDTLTLIRQCNLFMPLSRRVEEFWDWFVKNEEKLSDMMQPQSKEEADAFTEFVGEGTGLLSENTHFNIGGDHEFTFSVEGWPDLFILYPYIISRMPESLKGKWKFFPFNQGMNGSSLAFKMYDTDVDMAKIKVNASYLEESNDFNIRYYDENLCALPEEKSDGIFHIILELMLGEGVSFKYIREIERVSGTEDGMITLSELRRHIEEILKSHNQKFFENPKDIYTDYQLTPKESDELRSDVIVGSTCLYSLVADYYNDSTELFDHANSFGAQALFMVFPNGADSDGHQILDFRHDLEDRITDELLEPEHLGLITGGATGTAYSYIDLLVYDLPVFIRKIRPLLEEYPAYSFYISDFIRNGNVHRLTEADSDSIPYTKENAEAFFKQIEDWNDNNKYTKCIKALETIPADERDYELTMLLVRAYENYAILGDNNEEPETEECDRALNKALELLESVREAGESKAGWNMRMAYAYQYLTGQKEKAVAYAEKWAELDPEDEDAKLVIEECRQTEKAEEPAEKQDNIKEDNMNNKQKEAALAAMTDWLSHSQELGHKPAEIECTRTFVLHDMTYYIFKYRESKNGEWLLGVNGGYEEDSLEDCGHTFSEMKPYNESTAVKDATALVEMVRSYWMEQAKQAEERKNKAGTFVGFALLSENSWDKEKYIRDLKEQWNITAEESDEDHSPDTLIFNVGDMMAAVSLMAAPVPNGEAEECAKNNYMWPEAEKVARAHKAHIMVAVLGKEESLLERGKLYVKLMSACCLQKNVAGIYTSGVVFQPRLYEGFSGMMKEDRLPIFNWIWFGLYRTEKGVSGYTYGMECFGKDEMEVLDVDAEPSEVRDFLASMAGYVLEYDVVLNDGETIGFSAADKHRIKRGKGVALPDMMTLKISYGSKSSSEDDYEISDDTDEVMDDAAEYHLEKFEEKDLAVEPITAYNHLAIYLRWCMENDLMSEDFLEQFGDVVSNVKNDSTAEDLRLFIRDNLNGRLTRSLFNKTGRTFADYYYGAYYGPNESPFYPSDIDNYALDYFGPDRYHSNEFKEEAYLYIPYDDNYYQAMSQVIGRRFANWHGQHIDKDTTEPSDLARALMDYLDCECTYFPSMSDDDPIMSAYTYAKRLGVREGFIPVLVKVDEGLWENLIRNSDPDSKSADDYVFNREKVREYRNRMLESVVADGKAILDHLTGQDNGDIDEELEGGFDNNRYSSYWNADTNMTYPLILARIPVREPWKIFAYLPFGGWNDCPETPELMAVSKYWYEEYGTVPSAFTNDELEYELPAPVPEDKAMETAIQQYAFCPDMDQNCDGVGSLADTLRQSRIWYFWWD